MRVAMTGASGALGSEVLRQLLDQNIPVRALFRKRNARCQAFEREGAEIVLGNLDDGEHLARLVRGADQVIHCAAETKEKNYRQMLRTNVTAAHNLALTSKHAGVRHFIFLSSAAVYGEQAGHFRESSDLSFARLRTRYARTKFLAERALEKVAREMPISVFRPTVLIGPGSSWSEDPLNLIARGIPMNPGSAGAQGNFLTTSDAASALIHAMLRRSSWGQTYNLTGFQVPWEDLFQLYADILGKPAKKIPRAFFYLAQFMPMLETYRQIVFEPRTYSGEKLQRALSWEPQQNLLHSRDTLEHWIRNSPTLLQRWKPLFSRKVQSKTFHTFHPAQTVVCRSETEVTQAVLHARETGKQIRARGALHSFAPLCATPSILLDLRPLTGITEMGDDWVRARAGTQLSQLMEELKTYGKCIPTHGSIKTQTVAGVISTGTHGCTLKRGSLSGLVRELTLINAEGTRQTYRPTDPDFELATLSLGTLGVVVEVCLTIIPSVYVEESVESQSLSDFKSNQMVRTFEQEDYGYWMLFPRLDLARHTRFRILPNPPPKLFHKVENVSSGEIHFVKWVLPRLHGGGWVSKLLRHIYRWLLSRQALVSNAGHLHAITASDKPDASREYPVWDLSFAVSLDEVEMVLDKLLNWYSPPKADEKPYHRYFAPLIQVRPQGKERVALSASHHENRIWFEVWIDHRAGQEQWEEACRDFHRLFAPHHYRLHWGKNTPLFPEYLEAEYPELADFRRLCLEKDPAGMFRAPYLEPVLRASTELSVAAS